MSTQTIETAEPTTAGKLQPLDVHSQDNYHHEMLERFSRDVADHRMEIRHDDGLYRHIVFAKEKNSWHCRFELITSPWQLTIRGDMGCFVFSRQEDMIGFFNQCYVNAHYWAEKVVARDQYADIIEHDEEKFTRFVLEDFRERRFDYEPKVAAEIWADIRSKILDDFEDRSTRDACLYLLDQFSCHGFEYDDVHDRDFTDYSAQYLWCCHAILWGVKQYLAAKKESL
ncbi:hypothetical protein D477_014206 [Arthrobacter crystallopoietes BAB-32]|uniref:Uncharacterized protein n=1 Tax=Arthrobacter crystallopoietes BAB-32 TaxID=1246476 RepID=N1UT18_9MICC|nr:hypothetical protein [Arthrobacter crystallopoietes]EMY33561.1 hypothetical protein D477_014206 [Arthrobacter crystallopoietes BAB-32]